LWITFLQPLYLKDYRGVFYCEKIAKKKVIHRKTVPLQQQPIYILYYYLVIRMNFLKNTKLCKVFNQENNFLPIWFMRQAGRYLPEYKEIRKKAGSFLDLCYNSDFAAEVTMQPIRRFSFDAAIIFADILVLPHALGWSVTFDEGIGPVLRQFKSEEDFIYLNNNPIDKFSCIYKSISKVRAALPHDTSLIGFAGSPWTVMSYMLEGKGKQDFSVSKRFLYQNRNLALTLVNLISDNTVIYLLGQIQAGADVVQLFDSWSGMLNGREYEDFIIKPTKKIVSEIKKIYPEIPIIGFPKGSGFNYEHYIDSTKIDGVSVDQFTPVSQMNSWKQKLVVQGNFDPVLLLTDQKSIATKADEILSILSGKNFIFNLGHGILPTTPPENVEFLVNYVRNYKK